MRENERKERENVATETRVTQNKTKYSYSTTHTCYIFTDFLDQLLVLAGVGFLHPVEEPATGVVLELEQEDTSSGALWHRDELCLTRKDNQVLGGRGEEGRGEGEGT